MFDYNEELQERKVDMAEVYRQNYMDALDEVRNLRAELADAEATIALLNRDIDRAENYILASEDEEEEELSQMERLMLGLRKKGIDFRWMPVDGGEQVVCEDVDGNVIWDAVCRRHSYGYEDGLLEIMGCIVTDDTDDDVEGYLTANDILERL